MRDIEVVIPATGDTRSIDVALSSIRDQTLCPVSVLIVDDGLSNPDAVDQFGRAIIGAKFRRIPNRGRGISDALNTGIACCTAPWIARMDADDRAHPRRFEFQMRHLESSSANTLGCGTQVQVYDEHGNSLTPSGYPTEPQDIARSLLERTCHAHPSLILRRDSLVRFPYRRALDGAEDVDLVLRLSGHGRVDNLADVLLDYQIRTGPGAQRSRPRQTALQELAFRLALIRRSGRPDPLDENPGLAERFVDWRLSQRGYAPARRAGTALRYAALAAKAGSPSRAIATLTHGAGIDLLNPAAWWWLWRIARRSPGALARDQTPFPELALA